MDAPAHPENDTPDQTPPDAGSTANPSPVPAPAEAATAAHPEAPDVSGKQANTAQAAPAPAPQPSAESAPKPTTPPPGAPYRKPDGDAAASLTPRQQLEQVARQVDQVARTAPDSPLHYVALARYFGIPPQAVAAFPEEVKLRYAQERFDSLVQGLDGQNLSPYLGDLDSNAGKGMPVGKNPLAAAQDAPDGAPDSSPATPDNAQATRHADPQVYWLMGKGPLDLGGHGAPVATPTLSTLNAAAANLAVGDQKANGVIAEGSEPGSRVYVVKSKNRKGVPLSAIADELGIDFDQLKEFNKFSREDGYRRPNGTTILLPARSSDSASDATPNSVVDRDVMIDAIHRAASSQSKAECRKNVLDAVDAGRAAIGKAPIKRPANHYAEVTGPALEEAGFRKIVSSADDLATYTPRKGDIVVLQHYDGQGYYRDKKNHQDFVKLPAGHIAVFDGKYWVSDFVQNGRSRIWGGPGFEDNRVGLAVYRP